MLKPLIIANKAYPNNFIQGPLAGISCAPFRALVTRYSQPAFCYTEMLPCKTLLQQDVSSRKRWLMRDPAEGPLCFQLAASDPLPLMQACEIVTDLGADLIDLNCGCPVKKIRRKGEGSSLLNQPTKLYALISAMKKSTHLPVSIKIRVEGHGEFFHQDLIKVITEAGVDFLVVHGRHWTEHYETACHYESIAFFVNNLTIPVIGNGDVSDIDSLQKMLSTGCAGVMIARAGVGQPWLIKKLIAAIVGQSFKSPDCIEIAAIFNDHIINLSKLLNNEKQAILQARQLAKYYARDLPAQLAFCRALQRCDNFKDLEDIFNQYFMSPG